MGISCMGPSGSAPGRPRCAAVTWPGDPPAVPPISRVRSSPSPCTGGPKSPTSRTRPTPICCRPCSTSTCPRSDRSSSRGLRRWMRWASASSRRRSSPSTWTAKAPLHLVPETRSGRAAATCRESGTHREEVRWDGCEGKEELRRPLLGGSSLNGGHAPHQTRLVVGRRVLVDDALGGSLVDPLHGQAQRLRALVSTALGGAHCALRARPELGPHRLVAQAALLVLAVPLDLALDVGHRSILSLLRKGAAVGRGLTVAEDNSSRWGASFGRRHRAGLAPTVLARRPGPPTWAGTIDGPCRPPSPQLGLLPLS